ESVVQRTAYTLLMATSEDQMKSANLTALLSLACTGLLHAQAQPPVINANTVVNAASRIPPGLPNYGVAQGITGGHWAGSSSAISQRFFSEKEARGVGSSPDDRVRRARPLSRRGRSAEILRFHAASSTASSSRRLAEARRHQQIPPTRRK